MCHTMTSSLTNNPSTDTLPISPTFAASEDDAEFEGLPEVEEELDSDDDDEDDEGNIMTSQM